MSKPRIRTRISKLCEWCGSRFERWVGEGVREPKFCGDECRVESSGAVDGQIRSYHASLGYQLRNSILGRWAGGTRSGSHIPISTRFKDWGQEPGRRG